MLELNSTISLEKIEELNGSPIQQDVKDILLSKKYNDKDFFGVVSLAQVIFSWLRKYPDARIIIPFTYKELDEMRPDDLRDFVREEVNYLAILSAWPRIYSIDGKEVLFKIQEHTRFMRAIMNSPAQVDWRAQKGNAMFLPCFDQYAEAGGHVNSFYYAPSKFYSLEEFRFSPFGHRLSFFLKSFNFQAGVQTFQTIFEDLNRIVYELMLNTHQWARTDGNNKILNPNSRGIYLKVHKAPPKSFQKEYQKYRGVLNYFKPEDFKVNANGEMSALEISVFDSGPGYVKRYLGTNSPSAQLEQNVNIIKHCLFRHNTSAKGGARIVKGMGLDKVMELLSNKGLFRIRSGNCSIYRDMKSHPYKEFTNAEEIDLFDWVTGSSSNFTEMPTVEGAVFSILYPLI